MALRRLLTVGTLIASSSMLFTGLVSQVGVGIASADPASAPICTSAGTPLSGDYRNLTVTGNAYVPDGATLNVSGNLTLAPGSCLDAFSLGTVQVGRNVLVLNGATLALGCAPGSNGPPGVPPCYYTTTNDTVGGNIIADQPLTMYLTAVTVAGNVVSNGGGPGVQNPAISFPVKSMNIGGNLILNGWQGAWIGALRNNVGGNVIFNNNAGSRLGDTNIPDSSEVVGNTIRGNLICQNNTPAAGYGDAYNPATGNGVNFVGGHAIGECQDLTNPPS